MNERTVMNKVQGFRTVDGAGVHLVRVLGNQTVDVYDPILMLDSFDSTNPADYTAGFPMHPHRGIETISYVYKGAMQHKDSLGSEDTVTDGGVQWMTAGSGILHEEKLPAVERMLGVQLWLNLPKKYKMVPPAYHAIPSEAIEEITFDGGYLRLLAGNYVDGAGEEYSGYQSKYLPLDYYDIHLEGNQSITINTKEEASILVFTLLGDIVIGEEAVPVKTAAKLSRGESVTIKANSEGAQVLFVSSEVLGEPIAWGGPVVMNTQEELREAFTELREGTFLKDKVSY